MNNIRRSDALAGDFLLAGSTTAADEPSDDGGTALTAEQQESCVAYGQRFLDFAGLVLCCSDEGWC